MSRCGGNHTNPITQTPPTGAVPRVTQKLGQLSAYSPGYQFFCFCDNSVNQLACRLYIGQDVFCGNIVGVIVVPV